MNAKQREFLVSRLRNEFSERIKAHRDNKPKEPDLNNHLIVAFSEGSINFASLDSLREKMRQRVLAMTEGQRLIEKSSRAWNDSENFYLKILPEDLIELPESYTSAMREYEEKMEVYNQELKRLSSLFDTLELKIMLADDKALSSLIGEANNLIDLSLVNDQLLLK